MLSIYIAGKIRKDRDVKFRPADYNVMTEEEYIAAMPVPVVIENSDIDNFFLYSGPFAIGCDHGCYHGDESHGARGCNKIKLDDGSESRVGCQCEPALDKELVYETCKRQIKQSDVFLAWIDSSDCYGTLVEIGFAKAAGIPVYIVFADGIDKSDFWFVAQFGRVLSGTILQVLRIIKNYHLATSPKFSVC